MNNADKFTEGQRVQCIDVGDTGTVVEHGRIKLDRNDYIGGWFHRRFKEIEEAKATQFKAGQRIIVTSESTWAQGLTGVITGNKTSSSGNFMGYLVTFDDQTKNNYGDRVFWKDHELTLEAKEFNVGEEVKVIKIREGAAPNKHKFLGKTGIITEDDVDTKYRYKIDGMTEDFWWSKDELEPAQKTMTVTEALHAVVDGKTVVRVDDNVNTKMFMDGNALRMEDGAYKEYVMGYLNTYPDSQWKIYVEPPKPKFTKDTLVHNTDGTIGKVIEDKGIGEGERWYSVKFNAIRDTLRSVKESELSSYE